MEPVSEASRGSLEATLQVIGVVRHQLGVAWTDLGVGPGGADATFSLGARQLRQLRLRRRGLLVGYVDRVVAQHGERIESRRARTRRAFASARDVRAWGNEVDDHVAAVRRLCVPVAPGGAG